MAWLRALVVGYTQKAVIMKVNEKKTKHRDREFTFTLMVHTIKGVGGRISNMG